MNYLRHACSSYEEDLSRLHGRVGNDLAASRLRERVLEVIATRCPELVAECGRQGS